MSVWTGAGEDLRSWLAVVDAVIGKEAEAKTMFRRIGSGKESTTLEEAAAWAINHSLLNSFMISP